MNAFDYFFENSFALERNFLLGPKEVISFKELFERSLKLASHLNQTIGRNKNILLLSPNSVFFMISYLGILKSGNVAVPLNPEIEQNNLDFIKQKCDSNLIISTAYLSGKLNFNDLKIIDEGLLEKILADRGIVAHNGKSDTNSEQLAEIIFTSGSTGEPKGVMISHKNLIANTESIVQYLQLTGEDIMLVVLPFYYCYGLSLLHTHLRIGGSVVLNNMFIMLGGIINDLKRFNCTGFAGVPTHFQVLLRKSDSFKSNSYPHLRYVTQAGGKLHNAFISEFLETFPEIKFNVMYGQTEATARLSWLPPEKLPEKIGSCGKAIPGVILKVTDEKGFEVKPGETGEILAYGDNIMQGYYLDPAATDATIKDGWLRTGDLATIDQEGFIYLTARKKEILKIGGRRVSPKEIEEVINTMHEVIDCTIEGVFDEILGETMKATVIVKDASSHITPDTIKEWCGQKLSPYKIPQLIEIRDRINLSATGKKVKK
jgi:acyl-CoA synthetase (AMP-forming)/AMP-acid ligase II